MKNSIYILAIVLIAIGGSGCSKEQSTPTLIPTPTAAETTHELRVSNIGSEDIQDLVILFPGSNPMIPVRVAFGDVAVGETTAYQRVPGGVYKYAAYEYTFTERTILQSVTDWIGEQPMQGNQFTYEIIFDSAQIPGRQVQLLQVTTEVP